MKHGRFTNVSARRSRMMASVRGKRNQTTEVRLRMGFVRAKVRGWIMHPKHVEGRPDFYFTGQRLAVFADGCFWHGCPDCGHFPIRNSDYWRAKILRNRERDLEVDTSLSQKGIRTLRIWEHRIRDSSGLQQAVSNIRRLLR